MGTSILNPVKKRFKTTKIAKSILIKVLDFIAEVNKHSFF